MLGSLQHPCSLPTTRSVLGCELMLCVAWLPIFECMTNPQRLCVLHFQLSRWESQTASTFSDPHPHGGPEGWCEPSYFLFFIQCVAWEECKWMWIKLFSCHLLFGEFFYRGNCSLHVLSCLSMTQSISICRLESMTYMFASNFPCVVMNWRLQVFLKRSLPGTRCVPVLRNNTPHACFLIQGSSSDFSGCVLTDTCLLSAAFLAEYHPMHGFSFLAEMDFLFGLPGKCKINQVIVKFDGCGHDWVLTARLDYEKAQRPLLSVSWHLPEGRIPGEFKILLCCIGHIVWALSFGLCCHAHLWCTVIIHGELQDS